VARRPRPGHCAGGTASNGLIAVRRAARQSKSVRFTALLHHITTDLLKQSYLSLERDSAPGIDGAGWHFDFRAVLRDKGRAYFLAPKQARKATDHEIDPTRRSGILIASRAPR
jgi:hypothetical protein